MLIGYARVSTSEQDTRMQLDALHRAGCRRIREEKRSGGDTKRPELRRALDELREGDTLVVYKLDRLARSLRHLLNILAELAELGAGFRSLTESIDTTTPAGRMMMHMLGAVAEFERGLIAERSIAGQQAAMARGVHCGRPAALTMKEGMRARELVLAQKATLSGLARLHGVHESSIKRAIVRAAEMLNGSSG